MFWKARVCLATKRSLGVRKVADWFFEMAEKSSEGGWGRLGGW